MTKYCLGFLFEYDIVNGHTNVYLIKKNKPEW